MRLQMCDTLKCLRICIDQSVLGQWYLADWFVDIFQINLRHCVWNSKLVNWLKYFVVNMVTWNYYCFFIYFFTLLIISSDNGCVESGVLSMTCDVTQMFVLADPSYYQVTCSNFHVTELSVVWASTWSHTLLLAELMPRTWPAQQESSMSSDLLVPVWSVCYVGLCAFMPVLAMRGRCRKKEFPLGVISPHPQPCCLSAQLVNALGGVGIVGRGGKRHQSFPLFLPSLLHKKFIHIKRQSIPFLLTSV